MIFIPVPCTRLANVFVGYPTMHEPLDFLYVFNSTLCSLLYLPRCGRLREFSLHAYRCHRFGRKPSQRVLESSQVHRAFRQSFRACARQEGAAVKVSPAAAAGPCGSCRRLASRSRKGEEGARQTLRLFEGPKAKGLSAT